MNEFLTDEAQIRLWLDKHTTRGDGVKIIIDKDGAIDIEGSICIDSYNIEKLPVKFKTIYGNFQIQPIKNNGAFKRGFLNTLIGCPQIVKGFFDCSFNRLTNLIGGPEIVTAEYFCNYNKITSLGGMPTTVRGLLASNNKLSSLRHFPKSVKGSVNLCSNSLINLDDLLDCTIRGQLFLSNNPGFNEGGADEFLIEGEFLKPYIISQIEKKNISQELKNEDLKSLRFKI